MLEGMSGDNLYFVRKGLFVSQKTVSVDSLNFWPISHSKWESQKVQR